MFNTRDIILGDYKLKEHKIVHFKFVLCYNKPVSSILSFFEVTEVVLKGLFCHNSLMYKYIQISLLIKGDYRIFILSA